MASKALLKEPRIYKCQICGKEIIATNIRAIKYCNDCKTIGNVIRNEKNRFGRTITVEEAKIKIARGSKNTYEALQRPVVQVCKICGKEFMAKECTKNRTNYCSRECRLIAKSTRRRQHDIKALLNETIDDLPSIPPASILGLRQSFANTMDIRTIFYRSKNKEVQII